VSAPVVSPDDVARIVATKKAWEDRLLANPNVTGVDIDHKMVGGQYVDAPCIVVYVARKGLFAESERIPATLDGVRTDVVEASFQHVPGAGGAYDSGRYNPCKGGAMISPMRDATNYGTLGCLVTDKLNGDRKCWLGCYHVICGDSLWDAPGTDQRIVQPAKFTGAGEGDVIGFIVRGKYGRASAPNSPGVYIDAALVSNFRPHDVERHPWTARRQRWHGQHHSRHLRAEIWCENRKHRGHHPVGQFHDEFL